MKKNIHASTIQKINTLHNELCSLVQTGLDKAITIGELLYECKSEFQHGNFSAWVSSNCNFSIRTAQNYMKLHSNRHKLTGAHSLTQAYRLLKNETVSLLTWDDVFECLESLLTQLRLYDVHGDEDPPVVDKLRSRLKKFLDKKYVEAETWTMGKKEAFIELMNKLLELIRKIEDQYGRLAIAFSYGAQALGSVG